jgi:glycosyltransferase involved in cell wall biosynthesis
MRQFVLVDQSLRDLGGHHYPFAVSVLKAAAAAGLVPVLATHRGFREREHLPADWQVHRVFRQPSYSRLTHDLQTERGRSRLARLRELIGRGEERGRRRHMRAFAADCARLFAEVRIADGDQVLMATTSELDFAGLVVFLAGAPSTRSADWHLLFHFPIFRGREPDYGAQSAIPDAARAVFREALERLPRHRLHFYTTTEPLAVQYSRLGVAQFNALPYPVHELFRAAPGKGAARPLRIACVGHSRREKGYGHLEEIMRPLWADYFAEGRAQLVLQTSKRKDRLAFARRPGAAPLAAGIEPVAYAPSPLDLERYAALVRSADIGLMIYEGERYYTRCSGVLLEMLCCGVPVIVPAGSWLAEQIAEENQRWLAQAASRLQRAGQGLAGDDPGVILEFGRAAATRELAVPPGATELLLRFRWQAPAESGTYVRVEAEQSAASGAPLKSSVVVAGHRPADEAVRALVHLDAGSARLRLSWRNAWHDGPITLSGVTHEFVAAATEPGGHCPMGAVGLAFAEVGEIPQLLREMLDHSGHYRERARAFSLRCAEHHNPRRLVAELLQRAGAMDRAS